LAGFGRRNATLRLGLIEDGNALHGAELVSWDWHATTGNSSAKRFGPLTTVMAVDGNEEARQLTNAAVRMIALMVAVVGGILLWLSGSVIPSDWPQWAAFASQLGGLLMATALVTFAWEQWGRRHFARELMAMANLSTELKRSGITRVNDQYLDDVQLWSDLFRGVHRLDIVVAYASTWRNSHRQRLQAVANNPKARIRVFLPDLDDPATMTTLSHRFNTDPESLSRKIREAIEEFRALAVKGGAELTVYVRKGDLVFSCYRFDSQAVVTLYSHSRKRQTRVPMFVVDGGDLFSFVYGDINEILEQSVVAPN
jgi:hypothetical protein